MKPGDKVRMLHGMEEGIVIGFPSRDLVEIEISGGFVIPVLRRELVPVHRDENLLTGRGAEDKTSPTPASAALFNREGVYLYIPEPPDQDRPLQIYNNSAFGIFLTLSAENRGKAGLLAETRCAAWAHHDLGTELMKPLMSANRLLVQILWINEETGIPRPAVYSHYNLLQNREKCSTDPMDGNRRNGWLLRIDGETAKPDPELLRSRLMDGPGTWEPKPEQRQNYPTELTVDLHIEALHGDTTALSPAEILDIQLKTFEKELDTALAQGARCIKFIHGLGNGNLRRQIHRRLASLKHIGYFEDADKSRSGSGATIVHFSR